MSRSKDKGTAWETAIVVALRSVGFYGAERRTPNGTADRGDITGVPGLVVEAKNCGRTELAQWVDEAQIEAYNAGASYGVVWHHRRGRARAADGFVTMTGGAFLRLLADAQGIGEEP